VGSQKALVGITASITSWGVVTEVTLATNINVRNTLVDVITIKAARSVRTRKARQTIIGTQGAFINISGTSGPFKSIGTITRVAIVTINAHTTIQARTDGTIINVVTA
tara:strand:+ start:1536 stop:1859 length:324 start_codon:yes stop_codon:yes gene_type:complete